MGGGITKINSNAFTLIELLAIIVILAIIAVITVPIILNIIENSRKGAATDSAYGYKDSVNKFYIAELQNHNKLKLDGIYIVNSDGSLEPTEDNEFGFGDSEYGNSLNVAVSGTIPSSGKLRYSNNVLNAGCVVIGDYKVTFGTDGKVNETVKGDCSDYVFVDPNLPTMSEMCPGCVFGIGDSQIGSEVPSGFDNDYTSLGDYFLGHILKSDGKTIDRSFSCGKAGNNYFCIEGGNPEKYDRNKEILTTFFTECDETKSTSTDYEQLICGMSITAFTGNDGSTSTGDGSTGCTDVSSTGYSYFGEP